ncbi:hypothetical protein [Pseudomonas sp. NBRC 100443]|uniref:hypothetical protein n=1 Tax=Pseudomonas sp. NBRC 100443 TaxID=1113665 RepID=UPI0024A34ED5|nr:hypothetical protein [Pseudomonas sp. NBRC 100443]GLU40007.1 hypothetical protein Pssp01_41000 [Pseudomonas sp. NBRC 100443]
MKCPHCSTSINPFSPAIMGPSKPGGARECKQCNNKFSITADKKVAVIAAVATAAVGFFVLRPVPTVGPALWGFATVLVTFLAAARLKKA